MNPEIWTTTVETVDTPRGPRYRGIVYVGEGYPKDGPAPRGAQVRYTTRLHTQYNEAREQARGRTIHHNVFHSSDTRQETTKHHRGYRCPEAWSMPMPEPSVVVVGKPVDPQAEEDAELAEAQEYGFSFMVQS